MVNEDDLFFTCSMIEYIGRISKHVRKDVVSALGPKKIMWLYELADVHHCLPVERVADELLEDTDLNFGDFDNVLECEEEPPTFWEIGRVLSTLVGMIMERKGMNLYDALLSAMDSIACETISNFNCDFYCENPENIYLCWETGIVE